MTALQDLLHLLGRGELTITLRFRPSAAAPPPVPRGPQTIDAPMAGMFSPTVRAGHRVTPGQVVGLLDGAALEAPLGGRVVRVLVAEGTVVTLGQPLVRLAPEPGGRRR